MIVLNRTRFRSPSWLLPLALAGGSCITPPPKQAGSAGAGQDSASATQASASGELYGPTWADSSGSDGKGGVKLTMLTADKKLPLLSSDFDRNRKGDSSVAQRPDWQLFYGAGDKSLALEWTWVTTENNKFWEKRWAGAGLAFNDSWMAVDATDAKYLVLWTKTNQPDRAVDVKLTLHSVLKGKGAEDTGSVSLRDFTEGKALRGQWSRAVIPIEAFPNIKKVDLKGLQMLRFDVEGDYPENERVVVYVDNVHLSDSDMVTPVDNLGYKVAGKDLVILWDKLPGENIKRFIVKAGDTEVSSVDPKLREARIALSTLGGANTAKITVLAEGASETSSPMVLEAELAPAKAEAATVTVAGNPLHEISPYIFGTNYASSQMLEDTRFTSNRWGGNATSKYNYKQDLSNSGSDWYFLNGFSKPEGAPEEEKGYYTFIKNTLDAGADANFSIPMLPWIAKPHPEKQGRYCSFPLTLFPKQEQSGSEGCGNGKLPNGEFIWDFDPNYALIRNSPEFQKGLVENIKKAFGGAANKGVKFYTLDNEPGLWMFTHRDAMPKGGLSAEELADLSEQYALMIKSVDPAAKVIGFASWGVKELAGSATDYTPPGPDGYKRFDKFKKEEEQHRWRERKKHGGKTQLVYLLERFRQMEQKHGKRLIDIVDIHWYPELYGTDANGKEHRLCNDQPFDHVIAAKQMDGAREWTDPTFVPDDKNIKSWTYLPELRKDLWDPYHPVLPALRKIVEENYPGTKLAINEYHTGGNDHYHGAVLRAAVYGAFMQENLYMAENWSQVDSRKALYYVQKLLGNYDGQGARVSGRFVRSMSTSPNLASFVAKDGGRWQTLLVNKSLTSAMKVALQVPVQARQVESYQVAESLGLRVYGETLKARPVVVELPPFSVMLVVMK